MKCCCNGTCRRQTEKCMRGNYNRNYDPDYGRNMKRFLLAKAYKTLDTHVKSVVKD